MSDIVNKLWGMCHTLRHDGIDYGDYIEQLTYLLFLKMADEREVHLKKGFDWQTLKSKSGTDLIDYYTDLMKVLREEKGILGDIFTQSMPQFNNPVNLKRVINMIRDNSSHSCNSCSKYYIRFAQMCKKGAGHFPFYCFIL
jgi:type I restriction enzyme M protein